MLIQLMINCKYTFDTTRSNSVQINPLTEQVHKQSFSQFGEKNEFS